MTWRGGEAGSHEGTAATLCPSCVHANKLVPRLPAQPSHNSSLAAVSILCLAALGTTVPRQALIEDTPRQPSAVAATDAAAAAATIAATTSGGTAMRAAGADAAAAIVSGEQPRPLVGGQRNSAAWISVLKAGKGWAGEARGGQQARRKRACSARRVWYAEP